VWRRLKDLGVAQIGDGLVALPADARTQEQLEWLAEQIAEAHGTSTLWRGELTSAAQDRALIDDLRTARAAEYSAVAARSASLRADGVTGAKAQRELRSLRRQLRRIQRRDFFPPVERDMARAEITSLAEHLLAASGAAKGDQGSRAALPSTVEVVS
jgi:hypothetical protein